MKGWRVWASQPAFIVERDNGKTSMVIWTGGQADPGEHRRAQLNSS
ncbi:hypothetical protein HNQ59_002783 [Chitinivorax tropicus]|uniref:Uncharacterized protein n=1 Tax=Chitinivorax tropicus TaxID=714531 RepID=A0A840MWD5_9PROT|nr:hypothetical protein [Chitinivorax tropicus]MBB5019481.1 hypothetical protein [Chitinivorax tropicus]